MRITGSETRTNWVDCGAKEPLQFHIVQFKKKKKSYVLLSGRTYDTYDITRSWHKFTNKLCCPRIHNEADCNEHLRRLHRNLRRPCQRQAIFDRSALDSGHVCVVFFLVVPRCLSFCLYRGLLLLEHIRGGLYIRCELLQTRNADKREKKLSCTYERPVCQHMYYTIFHAL